METNFKFGITEQGDASLDLSWVNRMHSVIGAIVISKGNSEQFENQLIKFKDKCIYHATCTGLGGTIFQPNVPTVKEKLLHISRLINKGFPRNQIVIRIDPIIPRNIIEDVEKAAEINYVGVLKQILAFAQNNGIERIRYSYLDLYQHNIERLKKLMVNFSGTGGLTNYEIDLELLNENLVYEACAERCVPQEHKVGCISNADLKILGLDFKYLFTNNISNRRWCLCPTQKLELLNHNYQCYHKCAYCYWKNKEDLNDNVLKINHLN